MSDPDEPTQADVLAARFAKVPWRVAIRDAIRGRTGRGSMVVPDRLEGAVYGHFVGDLRGSSGGAWSADAAAMLRLVESLLGQQSSRADGLDGGTGSPACALPVALALRGRPPADVARLAAAVSGPADGGGDPRVAAAQYALVLVRLLAGGRDRSGVLARVEHDARTALGASGPPAAPRADAFASGWDTFATSAGFEEAVTRAVSRDAPGAAAIAGGLAGAYWGGSSIPVAWRRGLAQGPAIRALADRLVETDAPGWDGRPWRTSTSSPLRVDRLDLSGLDGLAAGAAGITFLPGRRYVGYHTGAHWRDLDTDAARLRELGVDALLLLVEDRELVRCRVTGIGEALAAHGVELVRFPIRDPLLPRDGAAYRRTIAAVLAQVRAGRSIAIACRGGLDRAGLTAGCLLREAGLGATGAIERVQRARRGALTLPDQQAYVRGWPPGHAGPAAAGRS